MGSETEGRIVKQDKVKWGVLGVASIANEESDSGDAEGRMERDRGDCVAGSEEGGRKPRGKLGIPKAYGSYEELLADAEIEAV